MPLGPQLGPRNRETEGRIKGAARAGFLEDGAIEFGWDMEEGKAGVKLGEGRV